MLLFLINIQTGLIRSWSMRYKPMLYNEESSSNYPNPNLIQFARVTDINNAHIKNAYNWII